MAVKKLTVAQAAQHFGVSKEAVYNRVRRGSLQSVIENNLKYVVIEEQEELSSPAIQSATNDALLEYIKYENDVLKEKIVALEKEIKELQSQQIKMLRDEKDKIERIYKDKDNQLKAILEVINVKQIAPIDNSEQTIDEAEYVELVEEDDETDEVDEEKEIELKKFLKMSGFSSKKRLKILTNIQHNYMKDSRIIRRDSKVFVKPDYYDYSDILE
ncbi:MAG: hypothetical protein U9N42_00250, partial [Campylobacterota bacterium]|nr:hypothetical protein [Campylobacterota bacterium]